MSEQTKPYFSLYVNLDHCKDIVEKFDELDKYRHKIHATFGDSINCFVFPTEGEIRVEAINSHDKTNEILDKFNSLLKEPKIKCEVEPELKIVEGCHCCFCWKKTVKMKKRSKQNEIPNPS